ncbi:MAG: DNA polymerase III subunit alpha, partial [Oscillospiraceae bacterium]|nr:DNA polymerase III subunit alpha [Oscillospiraceae bacterium]
EVARSLFDDMASFASYAFNKSHAAVYADVAYQTAYLKCHYPVEFMAALMTSIIDRTDKVIEYIAECHSLGIELLPPDINRSRAGFTVEDGKIRFGLLAVKSVGRSLIEAIVRERADGPFTSFVGFYNRLETNELNRRAVENLIRSGAMDCLGKSRKSMMLAIEIVSKAVEKEKKDSIEGQISFLDLDETGAADKYTDEMVEDMGEYSQEEILKGEKESTGLYFSSHPLRAYSRFVEQNGLPNVATVLSRGEELDGKTVTMLCEIESVRTKVTRNNETMAFVNIEDMSATMEMLVFPKVLTQYAAVIRDNNILVLTGRISMREEEEPKFLLSDARGVEEYTGRSGDNVQGSQPAPPDKDKKKTVYLRFTGKDDARIERITALLRLFSGQIPVHFYYSDTKQQVIVPQSMFADDSEGLKNRLCRVLGEENVVYK